jgi:hypothetical protein
MNPEIIKEKPCLYKREFAPENIIKTVPMGEDHRHRKSFLTVFPAEYAFYPDGRNRGGDMDMQNAILPGGQCAEGGLKTFFLGIE